MKLADAAQLRLAQSCLSRLSEAERATFRKVKDAFVKSGQEVPLIVYDMDDVLWLLLRRVVRKLEIDFERACGDFDINANSALDEREKQALFTEFANPDMFLDIEFLEGASEILRPRELGAKVIIKSNSYNQAILDNKIPQLLEKIDGLTQDLMEMHLVNPDSKVKKPYDPQTTIVVDDSPFNVAAAPALVGFLPGWMPWSTCEHAKDVIGDKSTIAKPTLVEVNQYIYTLTAYLMGYIEDDKLLTL